ncbi:alpha/beta hydrolase [Cohnella sp. WQ 127256]|uniref:alpha/beta hydrolase n=1 Tax=Cohnella sp. WQ 127256 TaxID=2938790 RepID=UPI0021180228|nr:lysophospholipase [Cohnella sp. WQ 127256]
MVPENTIQKTIMTGFVFGRFWDMWIANGFPRATVSELRDRLISLEDWIRILHKHAIAYEQQADCYLNQYLVGEAHNLYRLAGMHFHLIQWIYPETGVERRKWFQCSKEMYHKADKLLEDVMIYVEIQIDGNDCYGRICVPDEPKACVVIMNPLDTSKEEFYAYEKYFAGMGFVTVSFDGPGQGETYVFNKHRATRHRWALFVNQVIDFASAQYPELDLNLFGTGSGAAWAIYGSSHRRVHKTMSVSPMLEREMKIPDYFKERLSYLFDEQEYSLLPTLHEVDPLCPILLVHGNKDYIVKDADIYELYNSLPGERWLIEYENEGHCCNYKMGEILKVAAEWYLKGGGEYNH